MVKEIDVLLKCKFEIEENNEGYEIIIPNYLKELFKDKTLELESTGV